MTDPERKQIYAYEMHKEPHEGSDREQQANEAASLSQHISCVICLDDILEYDHVVHKACGGNLCLPCLEASVSHYDHTCYKCPVCYTLANPQEDFVRRNRMGNCEIKRREMNIPIILRWDREDDSTQKVMQLFGHPKILQIPETINGDQLFETVDKVIPLVGGYTLKLVDREGYNCSRCISSQHCNGCEIMSRQVSFQPGDNIVACFRDIPESYVEITEHVINHNSVKKWCTDRVTLESCFQAFTESEILEGKNSWLCTKCDKQQSAMKEMTVWHHPDTLIVYLKRFLYESRSISKIDTEVIFPMENLDLSSFSSALGTDGVIYDLQSIVCHEGGLLRMVRSTSDES